MKSIQKMVADHLQSREFNFNFNAERSVFDLGIEGNNGNWKVFIIADEKEDCFKLFLFVQYAPHDSNNNQCVNC